MNSTAFMRKRTTAPTVALLLTCLLVLGAVFGCGGNEARTGPGPSGEVPIQASAGFLERQAAYLNYCAANSGPGAGGVYNQSCAAYLATGDYNPDAWAGLVQEIWNRNGSVDFHLQSILRVLAFDRRKPSLADDLRSAIQEAVLGFKYWLDERGPCDVQWWSENHQILFHTAELMAGQLFPDDVFPNIEYPEDSMTGRQHLAHAETLAERWLDRKLRFGLSEWHSNVYLNEDMPALLNLVEFAENPAIATKASMLLDLIAFDFAMNHFRGLYATTHGRTYPDHLLGGLSDSTREAAWILLGLAPPESIKELSAGHFTACMLATSERYVPPPILEAIAAHALSSAEHRERNSITLEEGPVYGIGYESYEDVMFWWGLTGYVAPEIIDHSLRLIDDYDLWAGNLWRDLVFLRPLVGTQIPRDAAEGLQPMSRGIVLEAVNTYTYRTPFYQLSGAQDFKPGSWTGQVHVWQATLDGQAYVFTTYPGGLEDDYMAGPWTGGFVPRATFSRNVGILQYRRPLIPLLDAVLFKNYSHAYFRRAAFDEVAERAGWVMGRKGEGYVALYSQHPVKWSTENDYELIADAKENVWIVELGDLESSGTFQQFVAGIEASRIVIGETVSYRSPSRGLVEVGWTGPMTVEGVRVDLGPYDRWDNAYCHQAFGEKSTVIEFNGFRLELDFESPGRRLIRESGLKAGGGSF
jgi:hypothetical protein